MRCLSISTKQSINEVHPYRHIISRQSVVVRVSVLSSERVKNRSSPIAQSCGRLFDVSSLIYKNMAIPFLS